MNDDFKSIKPKETQQGSSFHFARTKILCTLGPATSDKAVIAQMIRAGMDGVRLNFSHGTHAFFDNIFFNVHEACKSESTSLAVLADLQGPKIRIGNLSKPEIEIKSGDTLRITIDDIDGTSEMVSTSYKLLADDAKTGDRILIDDGLIRLTVTDLEERTVVCRIDNGGVLKPKKGMNLPGMVLSTPSVTEQDLINLAYIYENHRVDFVALSFVRRASDITGLRSWMNERGVNTPIIAKIEMQEAVDNFEEILQVSDGIMVARGDLGVEMNPQDVPLIQKNIITRCNAVGKLVITATQMLESMVNNPIPTRAEASDVANAVWDGTDVVMLSAETSVGKFPVRTVEIMNNIVRNAGVHEYWNRVVEYDYIHDGFDRLFDSVNKGIVQMSREVGASAVVVFSELGRTARRLSKYRPQSRIIAISDKFETMNNLCLYWGVSSLFMPDLDRDSEILIPEASKLIVELGLAKKGDVVIFTSGTPVAETGRANKLKIFII
ncbi:MAG: pyruvate kinase [Ignavibacteriaceae bacterium]|nr:MAG: pyruvate kinase [Ignavibacteriaceae bacterium]MBW7873019.1 pyruvate kinase [Ignavibacteria bacterium]MBZ0195892.1 pyruvate kinase [Ignavibacteriaceae bacterium]OQY75873.1 MAG: pyruvate kinase [Ignavibacteriales bacterium UTCHB3]